MSSSLNIYRLFNNSDQETAETALQQRTGRIQLPVEEVTDDDQGTQGANTTRKTKADKQD
jgi:hypothetical protein